MFHPTMTRYGFTLLAAILLLAGLACSDSAQDTGEATDEETVATVDSGAAAIDDSHLAEIAPPPDTPEELERKLNLIRSWTPQHPEKLEFALRGVTKVVMFSDLGLGDQTEIVMPPTATNWPIGHSLRLKLDAEMTAVIARVVVDTLPDPRVRGEGVLGLFAVHADSVFGRDVELPRTHSGTGRMDILWKFERLMGQVNCCDIPPTFHISAFCTSQDTLTLIVTFDRSRARYLTTLVGPTNVRSYPGRSYCQFRTERGEYHKDQEEFPYFYNCTDPGYVNLFLGNRWRGRKTSQEPILRVRMF